MKLYFVRHGDAVDVAPSDAERPLSPRGIDEVRNVAAFLLSLRIIPDHIFASPRVRAQQTAKILGDSVRRTVDTREECNFDFSVDAVVSLTQGLAENAHVMFVGHNPSMSDVVRDLCGANVSLKTASIARVDIYTGSPRDGLLAWYLSPKVIRNLLD